MKRELFDHAAERALIRVLHETSLTDPGRARWLLEKERLFRADFHHAAHAEVFAAVAELVMSRKTADFVTVGAKVLDSRAVHDAGGQAWLSELLMDPSVLAFEGGFREYARVIRDNALRRRLLSVASDIAAMARDGDTDVEDAVTKGSLSLANMTASTGSARPLSEIQFEVMSQLASQEPGEDRKKTYVPTGIRELDRLIGGFPANLSVIGAMPGVGKSALVATLIQLQAQAGRRVGVFSLEDAAEWMVYRYLAHESGVNQFVLRYRDLNEQQYMRLNDGFARMQNYTGNIIVDDREELRPQDVVLGARDLILNHGCSLIVVDHIGELKMEGRWRDRHDLALDDALRSLRAVAKAYSVPVITVAHVRRREGLDQDKLPKLTDFANGSAFEKKARLALGLARKPDSDEMTVGVLKATNGRAGMDVKLRFIGSSAMVAEVERREQQPLDLGGQHDGEEDGRDDG